MLRERNRLFRGFELIFVATEPRQNLRALEQRLRLRRGIRSASNRRIGKVQRRLELSVAVRLPRGPVV